MQKTLTALVLGGTHAHSALIMALKERGYTTLLVDYLENPPAKAVADLHLRCSTLDPLAVMALAKSHSADLVISTCVDQAYVTACQVSEALQLPAPMSHAKILTLTDKEKMKHKMQTLGIPTAKYTCLHRFEDFNAKDWAFPLVVKPVDSNGSAGVRKVESLQELQSAFVQALALSRRGKVIVETYKTGIEIGVDCYIAGDTVHILTVRHKLPLSRHKGDVLQSSGSIAPVQLSEKIQTRLHEILHTIAQGFALKNTPLLLQALVDQDEINVIEFAPRIGGGLNYRTVALLTGFDFLGAAIDAYFGQAATVPEVHGVQGSMWATIIVYAKPGIFSHMTGVENLLDKGILKAFYFYRTPGSEIAGDMSTRARIGAFLLSGRDLTEIQQKLAQALATLEVFTREGEPVMRKDIYTLCTHKL